MSTNCLGFGLVSWDLSQYSFSKRTDQVIVMLIVCYMDHSNLLILTNQKEAIFCSFNSFQKQIKECLQCKLHHIKNACCLTVTNWKKTYSFVKQWDKAFGSSSSGFFLGFISVQKTLHTAPGCVVNL